MTIITISRGSYSRGKEIAERVAERLGYKCMAREVILEACGRYDVPEMKLMRAIHDAPTILERFGISKERYVAQFNAEFLEQMKQDNVVYHGLAGHVFLSGVSHVLKVRIIADLEYRTQLEMKRESISLDAAQTILEHDDRERRRWSKTLFGIDPSDPSLYHLVLHVGALAPEIATDIICSTAQDDEFQATPASKQVLEDLLLATRIRALLVGSDPHAEVTARDGVVHVRVRGSTLHEANYKRDIDRMARSIAGVREVNVELESPARFA
jgi:cytidylate kinase